MTTPPPTPRRALAPALALAASLAASTALAQAPADAPPRRPNVVFIVADDLGWRDAAFMGSASYHTPNLDALAARGMQFDHAYAASPLCSPTRASLLTGQWPGRLRITRPNGHYPNEVLEPVVPASAAPEWPVTNPETRTRLPFSYHTLGRAFHDAGYATAFMGKWHLGREPYVPEAFGFDRVVGGRENPGPPPPGYFGPWALDTLPDVEPGTHVDDVLAGEAVRFIGAAGDAPFLLCLWLYDVHAPFQAKPDLLAKYEAAGLPAPQRCAEMAAMVETMDAAVGRVVDALDAKGLADDTVIVFTSDNGGNRFDVVDGVYPTSNAPLRGGKGTNYEGGVRVPLVVRYDGVVAPGSTSHAVVTSPDFFPTLLDLAGLPAMPDAHVDGFDFAPALHGDAYERPAPIFSHFPHPYVRQLALPSSTVTDGDWKLHRFFGDGPGAADRFELYDLASDIGETHDLSADQPELVDAMAGNLAAHLESTGALIPAPNPNYNGNTVGYWHGRPDGRLSAVGGALHVEASGPDPQVITDFVPGVAGQAVILSFEVRADRPGGGDVYWTEGRASQFSRDRRHPFDVAAAGVWQRVAARIDLDGPLDALRIDPMNTPGTADLRDLRLTSPRGELLAEWPVAGE